MSPLLNKRQQAVAGPAAQASEPHSIGLGVWAAVGVAAGVILIAAITLGILLWRAIRSHRQLLADLEERGIRIGQQTEPLERSTITKPRAVLRRNALLPYSTNSLGWDTLPSRESVGKPLAPSQVPEVPPLLKGEDKPRKGRRGWSFSKRLPTPGSVKMQKVRNARLSAIIESPRPGVDRPPSPMLPIANEFTTRTCSPKLKLDIEFETSPIERLCTPTPEGHTGKPTSAPDLTSVLKPLPLFTSPAPAQIHGSPKGARRIRSISVPSIGGVNTSDQDSQPVGGSRRLPRDMSFIGRRSGIAPGDPVPPLPLRTGHSRSVSNNLEYSPSRRSASSFESATSSILIASSPATNRSLQGRLKQDYIAHDFGNPIIFGPRPMRPGNETNAVQAVHGQSTPQHFRRNSIRSNVAQLGVEDIASNEPSPNSSMNSNASGQVKTAESVRLSRPSTQLRSSTSLVPQRSSTPRCSSRCQVDDFGSPSERHRSDILQDTANKPEGPTRELSQSSTHASSSRSSGGNPFRWDPAPLQTGKPTIPRGSPDKKKAHRRQNCVRLSLSSAVVGPASRTDSPPVMHNIQEEPDSPCGKRSLTDADDGLISLDIRPLPRPPSISVFAPEICLNPTNLQASLTANSPTLSLTNYKTNDNNGSPRTWRHSGVSGSSAFTIPTFPSPVRDSMSLQLAIDIPSSENDTKDASPHAMHSSSKSPRIESNHRQGYDRNYPLPRFPLSDVGSLIPSLPLPDQAGPRPSPPPRHPDHVLNQTQDSRPCSPRTMLPGPTTPATPQETATNSAPFQLSEPRLAFARTPRISDVDCRNALTGPRTEPARDLRKTVAALRRMNSDADESNRAGRRYLQLGREATKPVMSPLSEGPTRRMGASTSGSIGLGIGLPIRDESCTSLTDLILAENKNILGHKELDRSSKGTRPGSSVWEDGEAFWSSPLTVKSDQAGISSSIMQTPASKKGQQTPTSTKTTATHARRRSRSTHSRNHSRTQSQEQSQNQSQHPQRTHHAHRRSKSSNKILPDTDGSVIGNGNGGADDGSDVENYGVDSAAEAEKRSKRRATGVGVLTPKVQVLVDPPPGEGKVADVLFDAEGFWRG